LIDKVLVDPVDGLVYFQTAIYTSTLALHIFFQDVNRVIVPTPDDYVKKNLQIC
jgi:hypothetical protein